MGKKKRILLNPKKFGKKHFEFLDNLDGTDDNIISSTVVPATLRTLNLTNKGDRTISVSAELYGSGSSIANLQLFVMTTGGVALATAVTSSEEPAIASSGSTGFLYDTALPALKDASGNPFVFPQGRTRIKAVVSGSSPEISLTQNITVPLNSIGLTSAQLAAALSGALDGSTALAVNMDQMSGSGPQHGSGSGVGSSDPYGPDSSADSKHGYSITVSGSASGSVNVSATATANNGHSNNGEVEIVNQTNMNASGSQVITITFTPRDVNNALSTDQAVSTTLTLS